MPRSVIEVVALLSKRSSALLLQEMGDNPAMVSNVLDRVMTSVESWEARGVTLDPVAFEAVTDVLVTQFAASFLASETLLERCRCDLNKEPDEADDVASG